MGPIVVGTEEVARGLDGHGDRVLIPIRHGTLALPLAEEVGGDPCIGLDDRLSLQAQARNVSAKGCKAD